MHCNDGYSCHWPWSIRTYHWSTTCCCKSHVLLVCYSQADQQLRRTGQGKMGDTLEKAAEVLMSCFRICASDRSGLVLQSKVELKTHKQIGQKPSFNQCYICDRSALILVPSANYRPIAVASCVWICFWSCSVFIFHMLWLHVAIHLF